MVSILQGKFDIQGIRLAIVTARFNSDITMKLEGGAIKTLQARGLTPSQFVVSRVPGAVEVPLAAKYFLDAGFDGVVALGAVVRGDTAHFDYVCQSVERGCTTLQLEYGRPVTFGILTTDTEDQALDRAGGSLGNKGSEAADVCLEMINLRLQIKAPGDLKGS